mmetsp:Transcript_20940/g.36037  ORF Transcript_20940/g.36037 Transcript_20940/m.36037 type:complete len:281 (+) Transcript_20940:173-1015(+)
MKHSGVILSVPIVPPNDGSTRQAAQKAKRGPRGGIYDPFPSKFYRMLDQIKEEGLEAVVSWLPHGRAFKIHKPKEFAASIMPRFFNQSKYTSFQRQLNLYGFSRCCRGRDAGAYHHPFFLRGRQCLLRNIVRTKIKGNGHKTMKLHEADPDFHAMAPLDENGQEMSSDEFSRSAPSPEQSAVVAPSAVMSLPVTQPRVTQPRRVSQPASLPGPSSPSPSLPSEDLRLHNVSPSSELSYHSSTNEVASSSIVHDLNESIFIHELAMGCTILCQLRKDTSML